MNVETVRDLYVTDLERAYAVEQLLQSSLEGLAADARVNALDDLQQPEIRDRLVEALEDHRSQTDDHVERLEQAFDSIGRQPQERSVPAVDGVFEETELFNNVVLNDELRPVYYLGTAEQIEHLEVDRYRRIVEVGEHLDLPTEAVEPMEQTLEEEEAMLEELRDLRESEHFRDLIDAVQEQQVGG